MKKILMSVAVIGFIGALAAGATSAYFSDTETSTGNTFTAGTLDLTLGDETTPLNFELGGESGLKPGDGETLTYKLNNVGSTAGYLNITEVTLTDTEETNPESETNTADAGELSAHISVTVTIGEETVYTGLLSEMPTNLAMVNHAIAAESSDDLVIDWEWNSSLTDNDAQGDKTSVDFEFSLTQNELALDD